MADDIKDAIKQLGSEREATIKELKNIIEQNQAIIKNTASTREEVKQATQDNKKANTEGSAYYFDEWHKYQILN